MFVCFQMNASIYLVCVTSIYDLRQHLIEKGERGRGVIVLEKDECWKRREIQCRD